MTKTQKIETLAQMLQYIETHFTDGVVEVSRGTYAINPTLYMLAEGMAFGRTPITKTYIELAEMNLDMMDSHWDTVAYLAAEMKHE